MENYDNNRYGWTSPGTEAGTPVAPEAGDTAPVETAAPVVNETPRYAAPPAPKAGPGYQSNTGGYYGSYYSGPYYQQGTNAANGGYTPPSYYNAAGSAVPEPTATRTKPRREGRNWVLISIAMMLVALLAGFGGGYLANVTGAAGGRDTVVYRSADAGTGLRSSNLEAASLSEVAAAASQSVVSIITENLVNSPFAGSDVQSGAGSGVIISADGYIITNNHVVSGADKVVVTLQDGTELEATVIGTDSSSDVAVLKVNATGLVPAVIADDSQLLVGDLVLAIGNPMGTLGGTVTDGIVSALNRDVTIDGNTMNLLQMSAAVSPGNSGGGLFNANAELVGIVNAKSSGENTEGLGFAIPISHAMQVAEDLINLGYVSGRPGMGVTVLYVATAEQALQAGVSELGVYVSEVNAGSAAEAAGMQPGDKIVAFGGYEVSSTTELSNAIRKFEVGDTVEIELSRGGRRVTVELTLQELQVNN